MKQHTHTVQVERLSSLDPPYSRHKHMWGLARLQTWFDEWFPTGRLTTADYAIAFSLLAACFFSFLHLDISYLGLNSLNFLFGNPLEFYDNAQKYEPPLGAAYLPPLYAIFALWLYPWKLLGVIAGPNVLPPYLIYWLKLATTITYVSSSYTFYLIAKEYFPDNKRAKYATAAWFTAPLALFSQFIYSQTDIFYVQLMLLGYLMFVRKRVGLASIYFGLSVTFKYFPAVSFFPLLLLFEKRLTRILAFVLVFLAPTFLIRFAFAHSQGFIVEGAAQQQYFMERIYAASILTADEAPFGIQAPWRIYLLPLAYAILCGITYFKKSPSEAQLREAAYVWLTSSILVFMFILWHAQWLIVPVPAIVLTSMLSDRVKAFMALDLFGMALFVAAVSMIFQHDVDTWMFRGDLLKIDFHNSYLMAELFDIFGDHSANVFLTGFSGYLVLQIVLKWRLPFQVPHIAELAVVDYGDIRRRFYMGLSIFLIPATFAICKDLTRQEIIVQNQVYGQRYALSADSVVEQTFVAEGRAIKSVSLLIDTTGRMTADDVMVELVDANGRILTRAEIHALPTKELSWHRFAFDSIVAVQESAGYSFRVLSAKGSPGNAFSLLASTEDGGPSGHSIIDGRPQNTDLTFRIEFLR